MDSQKINPIFTSVDLSRTTLIGGIVYTIIDSAKWWFLSMPTYFLKKLWRILDVAQDQLSISLLLKTFFVPWHRDSNIVGYLVGIIFRLLYLPLAITIYLGILVVTIIVLLALLLMPVFVVLLLLGGPIFA